MDDEEPEPTPNPWLRGLVFVGSAFLFAAFLRAAIAHPPLGLVGAGALFALLGWRWWSQARVMRMLRRGDVSEILAHWSKSFERVPHAETMTPLLTATAFAAYGRVKDARRALASAARGPAWEAALEHRLFLDTMLTTFEGDIAQAEELSSHLSALPVPNESGVRDRVTALRGAVAALVRAFQHTAKPSDLAQLESASETSPLVHWAMRYGAAIVAIDLGQADKARTLIANAPRWPEESAFRAFHDEIAGVLG